jgi:2-phosphosulfolactate phosphatase
MKITTLLTPPEIALLSDEEEGGWTGVVFDVLRATTSMVTGLAHGVERIIPVCTIEEARQWRAEDPALVLGGERYGDRIEGFDVGNSPSEYLHWAGRTVVTTTTNGTVAIRACRFAERTLVASLLNLQATADWILQERPERLRILCAGTFSEFALEDAVAAGLLVRRLEAGRGADGEWQICDATQAVRQLAGDDWEKRLRSSRNARALRAAGREADIDWALQVDRHPIVVQWDGEACRAVSGH